MKIIQVMLFRYFENDDVYPDTSNGTYVAGLELSCNLVARGW